MILSGKQASKAFRQKYGLLKPSLEDIITVILSQGYTIVEFNAVVNNSDVTDIIRT